MSADVADALADAPCGYVEVDAEGVITAANREFLRLAGRPTEEVVGQLTFPSLLAAGDRIYYETHYQPTLQMQGEIREVAFELVRPDGSKAPILVSANVGDDGSGTTRTVVFGATDRRRYEQELLRARRAAEAAEQTSRALAHTLQQSFIPPSMPQVRGLELAGAYRPAGDGTEVGGDFYDVFQVNDGEWVVVLGDVCGKGVEAAVLTAFVRHSVRALAVQLDDPAEMLSALNDALLIHESDRFCTALVLRLLRDDDRWLMSVSSAGHPLPLLISADGTIAEIGAPGSLLGVLSHPQLVDVRDAIEAGDRLVLYTDGVTDARDEHGHYGLDRLLAAVAAAEPTAAGTTSAVLDEVLEFQSGVARDDIALVVVAVLGEDAQHEQATEVARTGVEDKLRALQALDLEDAEPLDD